MISDPQEAQQAVTTKKGSPWSHLGRKLTDEEWAALKHWRKSNLSQKYVRGDVREDGRIFLNYKKSAKGGEIWGTHETWEADKRRSCEQNKRLSKSGYFKIKSKEARLRLKERNDPAEKQKWRNYHREYEKKWRTPARRRMYLPRHVPRAQSRGHAHPLRDRKAVLALYQRAVDLSAGKTTRYVVDHIIPIKHGGWTHELNLQVIPARDNFLKQAKACWMSSEFLDFRDVPRFLWPEKMVPVYLLMLAIYGHPLKNLSEAA